MPGLSAPLFPERIELEMPFRLTSRPDLEEPVTPFKASVVLFVAGYAESIDTWIAATLAQRCTIDELFTNLTQSTDLNCHKFVQSLYGKLDAEFLKEYLNCIQETLEGDQVPDLSDDFLYVDRPYVQPPSNLGVGLRKSILAFRRMEFAELTRFRASWIAYWSDFPFNDSLDQTFSSSNDVPLDLTDSSLDLFSPQIINKPSSLLKKIKSTPGALILKFVCKQVDLIQNHPIKAFDANLLELVLEKLAKVHKTLPQINYLRYLNGIRLKDFDLAQKALRDYVEWAGLWLLYRKEHQPTDGPAPPFMSKSYRYGALLDAKLCKYFGFLELSNELLHEALLKGQESCDTVCIKHALAELCQLSADSELISADQLFNLTLNTTNTKDVGNVQEGFAAIARANYTQLVHRLKTHTSEFDQLVEFAQILPNVSKKNSSTVQDSSNSLLSTIYLHCGYPENCITTAKQLLNESMSDPDSPIAEPHCVAYTNIVYALCLQGNFAEAMSTLEKIESLFPADSMDFAKHWMLCKSIVQFDQALFSNAESHKMRNLLANIYALNPVEAILKEIVWCLESKKIGEAFDLIHAHEKALGDKSTSSYSKFRLGLLRCDLWLLTKEYDQARQEAQLCMELLTASTVQHIKACAQRRLAQAMIGIGLLKEAIELLDSICTVICQRCNRFEAGQVLCAAAQARIQNKESKDSASKCVVEQWTKATELLTSGYTEYSKLGATNYMKNCAYNLALIYNLQEKNKERNKWSRLFKDIDNNHC